VAPFNKFPQGWVGPEDSSPFFALSHLGEALGSVNQSPSRTHLPSDLLSELFDLKSRCGLSFAFRVRLFVSTQAQTCYRPSTPRIEFLGSSDASQGDVRVLAHAIPWAVIEITVAE
jgi:hypothetical protein